VAKEIPAAGLILQSEVQEWTTMILDIVGRWIVTAEVRVPSLDIHGRRFDGHSDSGTGFPSSKYLTFSPVVHPPMLLHNDVSSGDRTVGQVVAAERRPYLVQRMCAYTVYRVTDDIKIFAFSYGQNFFLKFLNEILLNFYVNRKLHETVTDVTTHFRKLDVPIMLFKCRLLRNLASFSLRLLRPIVC
jgi:hypothetical protein